MWRASLLCTLVDIAAAVTIQEVLTPPSFYKDLTIVAPFAAGTVVNGLAFPGTDGAFTDLAFSAAPGLQMRQNMQAWPMDPTTKRPAACGIITIADDQATGWPNDCMGLLSLPGIKTDAECKAACTGEALCSSWQFQKDQAEPCWVGMGQGQECDRHRSGFHPNGGQRIQHGNVVTLVDLKNGVGGKTFKINSLTYVGKFTEPNGKPPTSAVGLEKCKRRCYTDIRCQFWQFFTSDGCFTDHGVSVIGSDGKPTFTTSSVTTLSGAEAAQFIGGEYVEHNCQPPPPPPKPPPPPPPPPAPPVAVAPLPEEKKKPKKDLTWLWWLLGTIPAILGLAACAYCLSRPKAPKTRAVKPKPPPVPEPQPPPPMPMMMVAVPTTRMAVQMAAPQYMPYTAPATTYMSAPTSFAGPATSYAAPATYTQLPQLGGSYLSPPSSPRIAFR